MITNNKILLNDSFIHSLVDSLPIGVILIDSNLKVQAVNNFIENTFQISHAKIYDRNIGEVLNCIDFNDNWTRCDKQYCAKNCQIMSPAIAALRHQKIYRHNALITLKIDDKTENKELMITSSPLTLDNQDYAIILLEDITALSRLKRENEVNHGIPKLLGNDPKIIEIREKIKVLSDVDIPVFIEGESGTGKELVASAIHFEGNRSEKPFIAMNCAALPESLLESELFGHVKGAFTGAIRDKKGRFELADGGTIFLDEIGDITPLMQVKLLRVLQEGTFEPVGGEKTIRVNVRIISATNRNIKSEIAKRNFREDLYYRLCVVPLHLPPLRERIEDIPLLSQYIFNTYSKEMGIEKAKISEEVLSAFKSYQWPGNVRELQNTIQYAMIYSRGKEITTEHLPASLFSSHDHDQVKPKRKRKRKLNNTEVQRALDINDGNKVEAAKSLGVSRSTLYRFLDSL
ncbi:sigma 54-interacting transcriptional regulator [candidate division KSB1 bacterium]|nr:sigma 54-interacting transcriptional regulator [candidate division KSB1 bacterium]